METRQTVGVKEQAGDHPGFLAAGELQVLLAPDWGKVGLESEDSGLRLQQVELVELEWLLLVTAVEEGHQDGPGNKKENPCVNTVNK